MDRCVNITGNSGSFPVEISSSSTTGKLALEKTGGRTPFSSSSSSGAGNPGPTYPIDFSSRPPIGTVIESRRQLFELVEIKPHVCVDGRNTELMVWRSDCAECGSAFCQTTSFRQKSVNRRCQVHKAPGRRVRTGYGTKRARAGGQP